MQYKNTLEAIYIQLNELQQNVASWGVDKEIRNIDVDLALGKLRDAYDLVLSLKAEPGFTTEPVEISKPNQETTEDDSKIEENSIEAVQNEVELIVEESPTPEIEKEIVIEEKPKSKEQIIEELTKKTKKPSPSDEKSNLSEKFGHDRPTLNEELSSQVASADLANHLKNRPITNLSSAIGLNEKFEFINTLFHGDKEKYEQTIEKLNMATNFNEAYNYLSTKLNWDMSDPSIQRILDLIRRKLIVNNNE